LVFSPGSTLSIQAAWRAASVKRSNNERGTFTTSLLLPDVVKCRLLHKQRLTIVIASAKAGVCFSNCQNSPFRALPNQFGEKLQELYNQGQQLGRQLKSN